jgi:hypothetical protein
MKTINDTQHYLKAKSAEGIKALMLKNNLDRRAYHGYQIIFANGFWYAWYDANISDSDMENLDDLDGHKGQ